MLYMIAVDYVLARVESNDLDEPVFTDKAHDGIAKLMTQAKESGEVVIVTNQAGPAYRFCFGDNGKLPTVKDVCRRLITLARATKTDDCTWFISTWDERIWEKIPEEQGEAAVVLVEKFLPKVTEHFLYWWRVNGLPTPGVSGHPDWRMPGTGMLEAVMQTAKVSPDECIMVAPEISREARAARKLGIDVFRPEVFAEFIAAMNEGGEEKQHELSEEEIPF